MLTDLEKQHLQVILKAAYNRHALNLTYFTALTGEEKTRLIEPYAVTETPAGVMVKAYQLSPDPGWRFFHLNLITKVADADQTFTPRRPLAIRVGDEQKKIGFAESKNLVQEKYRKVLLETLANMQVTREEVDKLRKYKKEFGISEDEARGVHYAVFLECLQSVSADGIVTRDEHDLVKHLHEALRACGGSVVD